MPRILRIINRFNLGGPALNVGYLTKYMAPDFETLLAGGQKEESEGSSESILREMGLDPVVIQEMKRSVNPVNDLIAYRKIKKIIREFRPDIVHTHAAKAGAIGRLAAFSCGVPVVMHTFHGHVFHSYFGRFKTFIYKQVERYLAKKSSLIIAVSEKQKYELADVYRICNAEKIKIIPLGFDLEKFRTNTSEKRVRFRERYRVNDDEIIIAIIGRLVPVKNHTLFLEAVDRVRSNTTGKIRAFIIGDGEEKSYLQQKATALNMSYVEGSQSGKKAFLTFTSWVRDVSEALAGVDIVALTSLNEGTPVSLIEAQAAAKSIVTTNAGGVEDVVIANETAFLSSATAADFSSKLSLLIDNKELRDTMGAKGRAVAEQRFQYRRLVNDMKTACIEQLEARKGL